MKNQKAKAKTNHNLTEDQATSVDMLKMFYDRPSSLIDDNGNPLEAQHDGSMGLLALGHIGLIEWRKSKEKYLKAKRSKTTQEDNNGSKRPNNL